MGQEAVCTLRHAGNVARGRVLLEHDGLIFRGEPRLKIPFAQIRSVTAVRGKLRVAFSQGIATFELGPLAARWAERIRAPKSLIDKLGVKSSSRVAVLGVTDATFWRQLRERTATVTRDRVRAGSDLIFLQADRKAALRRLPVLRRALRADGAIWVVAPKGQSTVREADVLAAGKSAGLVDVKVVAFSVTHTAHKFVIPLAQRRAGLLQERDAGKVSGKGR